MIIITWLNDNQGFVMSILTLVYVMATVRILSSNKKSAKAATDSNKQQLSLQLMDKRLSSYNMLNAWISISKALLITNFPMGSPIDAFNSMVYNNTKNEELKKINEQINTLDFRIFHEPLSSEEVQKLDMIRTRLIQERFFKRFAILNDEIGIIKQIEILFPKTEFTPIKLFCDSFMQAIIDQNSQNIELLKNNVQAICDKNILDSLWNIIKEI